MFLAFIVIPTLLGPFSSIPSVKCQGVDGNLLNSIGTRLAYQDIIFAPFATPTPALQLYQVGYPQIIIPPPMENPTTPTSKSSTRKKSSNANSSKSSKENSFSQRSSYRNSPLRTSSRVRNPYTKNYGYPSSSRYKMKKGGGYSKSSTNDSTKKNFYLSLVQKLLRSRPKKKEYSSSSSFKSSAPPSKHTMQTSASAMSAPAGGKGWGWGGGGGGSKISLLDLLLLKLTMLSLLGFLLNLLLNLASLFGFGFMTSTATYPVTMTTTEPATATGTATTGLALASGQSGWGWPSAASSVSGSGLGLEDDLTARTINSMAGNGWGWPSDQARLKLHVKLPSHGWNATTTTAPTELPPTAIEPTLTGILEEEEDYLLPLPSARATTRTRPKRETFKPYVDPTTSLEIFSKAVLNSMESAIHRYDCMEKIHCENNKQARVVGQWLDYFMPVYSLSLIGHRMEVHHSLFDHLRAIVLGATEANCKAHFPPCEPSDKGAVK